MPESQPQESVFEERTALYYPFIHVRSENWLKSALLAFQKVSRIVPSLYTLADEDVIAPYCELKGSDGTPLLDQAKSYTPAVADAQGVLFHHLKENEATLVQKYTEDRTPIEFRSGEQAFQMHRMKILDYNFSEWLVSKNLAWNTRQTREHDAFDWLTMHPRLGAAIMSILELTVARQDGLKVVTPSRTTHDVLLATREQEVLNKLLDVPAFAAVDDGDKPVVQELCQVVLITGFDLTRLGPEDIRDMVVDGGRELRKFYGKLNGFAGNLPPGLSQTARRQKLQAKADEVLADWRLCMDKLPQLKEAIKEGASDKGLEKAVEIAKDAVGAQSIFHFIGGLPGVALAVLVKAGSTMLRKKDTPYAFLNRMQKVVDKNIGALYVPQWRQLAS